MRDTTLRDSACETVRLEILDRAGVPLCTALASVWGGTGADGPWGGDVFQILEGFMTDTRAVAYVRVAPDRARPVRVTRFEQRSTGGQRVVCLSFMGTE